MISNTPFNTRIFSLIARYFCSTMEELLELRLLSKYSLEVMDGDRVLDMWSNVLSKYKCDSFTRNEYIFRRTMESFRMYSVSNRNILLTYFIKNYDRVTDEMFIKYGFINYSMKYIDTNTSRHRNGMGMASKDTALSYCVRNKRYERALYLLQNGSILSCPSLSIDYTDVAFLSRIETLIDLAFKDVSFYNIDETYRTFINTLLEMGELPSDITLLYKLAGKTKNVTPTVADELLNEIRRRNEREAETKRWFDEASAKK